MQLGIVTRNRTLYSTRRLAQAGRERKHDVHIIDPNRCTISLIDGTLEARRDGMVIDDFDCVIPRIGVDVDTWCFTLLRQLELQGVPVLNTRQGTRIAANKVRMLQELSVSGVPIPATLQTKNPDNIADLIERVGGPPAILKLLEGPEGVGVIKVDTIESAVTTLETLRNLGEDVLIQAFIAESSGVDIRAFVVDGEVVGAMERRSQRGDFRANKLGGGSTRKIELDDDQRRIALAAVEALGLRIAGVDLLIGEQGPLVVQVNASAGLEGVEKATGRDIATDIVKCVERMIQ